jgi:hypothetical protein
VRLVVADYFAMLEAELLVKSLAQRKPDVDASVYALVAGWISI